MEYTPDSGISKPSKLRAQTQTQSNGSGSNVIREDNSNSEMQRESFKKKNYQSNFFVPKQSFGLM